MKGKGKTLDVKVKDERSIYARVISFSRYIHVRLGIKFLIFETLKKEGTLSIYHVRSIRYRGIYVKKYGYRKYFPVSN